MGYCTVEEMLAPWERELTQLTDKTGVGAVNVALVQAAIDSASVFIDGYVAMQTDLPYDDSARQLMECCMGIARYRLYAEGRPKEVADDHAAWLKFLSDVSRKAIVLFGANGSRPKAASEAQMQSGGRIFGRSDNGFL